MRRLRVIYAAMNSEYGFMLFMTLEIRKGVRICWPSTPPTTAPATITAA